MPDGNSMTERTEQLVGRLPDRPLDPDNPPATQLRREEIERQPLADADVTAEMKALGYSQFSLPHISISTWFSPFKRLRDRIFGNLQNRRTPQPGKMQTQERSAV